MTRNHTIDIALPPPPSVPGFPPLPPGPPPARGPRRRWPVLVAAGLVGAVVAAVAAATITVANRDSSPAAAPQPRAPVTKTVSPVAPPPPAPLPTAQADHQTCYQGWDSAGQLFGQAKAALATLPKDVKVGDPAIPTNPDWNAAAQKAANLYRQASETLRSAFAPGTTPILSEAVATAVKELRLTADAIGTNDRAVGNAGTIGNATAYEVGTLCDRLAP